MKMEIGEQGLARVAAWPLGALEGLQSSDVVQAMLSCSNTEHELAREAGSLADGLGAIVSALTEKQDRRAVLDLRRNVYRTTGPIIGKSDAIRLVVALNPALGVHLSRHLDARIRLQDQTGAARQLYAEARERERSALHRVAESDPFGRALAIGAPDLFDRYTRDRMRNRANIRAREKRCEFAILDHLLRAVGRPVPSGLWAGVVPVIPVAPDDGSSRCPDPVGVADADGTNDASAVGLGSAKCGLITVADAAAEAVVAVDLRPWLEVAEKWSSGGPKHPAILRDAHRTADVWAILASFNTEFDEERRSAWRAAGEAARAACDALASKILNGAPNDVAQRRQAIEFIVDDLRACAGLEPYPRGAIVRVDLRLPFEIRWSQKFRTQQRSALNEIFRLHGVDGGAELIMRTTRESLGLDPQRRVRLIDAIRATAAPGTYSNAEPPSDRMSAFRSFGNESAAEAAQAIADAWEVTLEQLRSRKSVDLTTIGGIGLAIASPGTMLAGTGPGPAGSVLCEFRSDVPHFLAPRPQPLTFAARYGGLVPGPLLQARSWFRDWSDEGVEALDVVGADPMNPNAALVASVAETVIDASSVADLAEWTLGSDAHGRPWLFDALEVPHIALVHHASVFGIADCGSALLRRISNGFGWELPACLFPILPAERRRWRHLPMLTIGDDLVVSGERWILESEDLVEVGSGADSFERFSRWCGLVRRLELPESVVLRRSGSPNEPGQTILTDSILCVESFLERLEGIPRQHVLEAGPTVCDGLPMADGQRHLVQVVVSWRDRDHWSDHPPPKAGAQAAMTPSWTQLNLHFEVGKSGPRIPWRELSELFTTWTNDGVIRRWFFVRKPPGLRVRLDAADPRSLGARIRTWEAMRTPQTWFSRLCTARVSVYEPEYERMGGALGLDLLHDMLCATTSIVLRLEQEPAGRELRYPIAALGANWFLEHARLDAAEMADVWQRLDRCFDRTEAGEDSGTFRALTDPVGFADQLPDDLRTVLEELMGVAQTFGTRAQQLANGGTLAVGLRAWLADAILFQWNMYGLGLDLPAMASMVRVGTRLSLASRT